jgi:lipopolysaccharide/colanic/teichoic acid biosynthesis glycosyltransferase
MHNKVFTDFIIRFFDIFFSVLALIVFSPILILITIILRFTGEGEVFYLQDRIGKNKKIFKIIKFATMLKNSAKIGSEEVTLENDDRVLPVGRFLRKTKINELPQLINILKGDLSIIGPRPQTKKYYNAFLLDDIQYISQIKPGLSGLGSIIFRDEEKILGKVSSPIEFDLKVITPYKGTIERWFVMNRGIKLYFELIILTIFVVLVPNDSNKLTKNVMKDLPKMPKELKKIVEE